MEMMTVQQGVRSALSRTAASGVAAAWLLAISGCGGGSSTIPQVIFRPSHAEQEVAAVSPTATPAGGGTAAAAEVIEGGFGTIKGKIIVQGNFTPLPPLFAQNAAPKDNAICGAQAAPNETVIVNDGGLANTFVYMSRLPRGIEVPEPGDAAEFDQKHCVFIPHALVVQTGQLIRVLNDDAVAHNTHTYPKRNSPFNQTVAPNDRSGISLTYTRPETLPLQVGCDIHPWMVAYHLPVDHPWATVSAADGTFEIKNVPSGKHEFKVWHGKAGELERALSVTVKPDETTEVNVEVAVAKLSRFVGPPSQVIQLSSRR